MNEIRDDEDDVLARLEARIEGVVEVISDLKRRAAGLEAELQAASAERDQAVEQARAAREEAARLKEETDSLRARQKQAAARIKALLNQVEQMDLLDT